MIHSERHDPWSLQSELLRFGFGADQDAWVDVFREASTAASLGWLGGYEILGEVGRGGQGVVYRARQPGTERVVAVKRIRDGSLADLSARRRFEREIEAASLLEHPHIVKVFAVDTVHHQPLVAMEWVEGEPIDSWADGRDVAEILRVFLAACDAVDHAHQRGVIHRDLKPSNILVRRAHATWEPVVLDFGLAKVIAEPGATDTQTGEFVGTLAFASPEQAAGRGHDIDVRSDEYSLGVVLYRVLTGRLPHDTSGPLLETLQSIRDAQPPAPSRINPCVNRELDAIVNKSMAKSKVERYRSVAELADDLRRFLDGRPVQAHPPSWAYRLRKFIDRHRGACAAAAGVLAIIAAFSISLLVAARQTSEARRVEAEARQIAAQVSSFLLDTLATPGPGQSGPDVTVRQLLDAVLQRVPHEIVDRPAVAAEVYFTVGQTLARLWQWREALAPLRMAVELRRRLAQPNDEALARMLTMLGKVLSSLPESAEVQPGAVEVQREALGIRLAVYGDGHHLVAESKARLAYALFHAARPPQFDEAERLLNAAIDDYRRAYGPRHREIASVLHTLGYMRLRQRRFEEAGQLYFEAILMFRALNATDDPYYVECLHGYTSLLLTLRRYEDALAALAETIPLVESMYGRAQTQSLYLRQARGLAALRRWDEAIDAERRGLSAMLESSAADPAKSADVGALARVRGLVDAAVGPEQFPADEIIHAAADLPAELRLPLAQSLMNVATLLADSGRHAEGESAMLACRDVLLADLDASHVLKRQLQRRLEMLGGARDRAHQPDHDPGESSAGHADDS